MAAVEMKERGSVKVMPESGCARGCGACGVAVCPVRRALTGEFGKLLPAAKFGKVAVLTVDSPKEVPAEFKGVVNFNPEPPIRTSEKEKTCSECNKPVSACTCPRTL